MEQATEVVFDQSSIHWTTRPEHNKVFLQCQQNYMNHLLLARGHVFLNEIFDALGFNRTSYGQVAGWSNTANKIDFGLEDNEEFDKVKLKFNVEGIIYEELDD